MNQAVAEQEAENMGKLGSGVNFPLLLTRACCAGQLNHSTGGVRYTLRGVRLGMVPPAVTLVCATWAAKHFVMF